MCVYVCAYYIDLYYVAVVDKRVMQELVAVLGEDALRMKLDPPSTRNDL